LSTRSIIEFRQGKEKIQVYQHSDGYPSWTLPALERFIKWNGIRNGDLSYTVANFPLFGKLNQVCHYIQRAQKEKKSKSKMLDYMKEFLKPFPKLFENADSNSGTFHTGYGIHPNILQDREICESWCEWFYVVDLPTYDTFDRRDDFSVKITCYKIGKSELTLIGSTVYSQTEKKLIQTTKKLEKEMKN